MGYEVAPHTDHSTASSCLWLAGIEDYPATLAIQRGLGNVQNA